jgi:hypothetical protein
MTNAYGQDEQGQNYNALPHSLNSQHNQQENGKEYTQWRQNTGRSFFYARVTILKNVVQLEHKIPI